MGSEMKGFFDDDDDDDEYYYHYLLLLLSYMIKLLFDDVMISCAEKL